MKIKIEKISSDLQKQFPVLCTSFFHHAADSEINDSLAWIFLGSLKNFQHSFETDLSYLDPKFQKPRLVTVKVDTFSLSKRKTLSLYVKQEKSPFPSSYPMFRRKKEVLGILEILLKDPRFDKDRYKKFLAVFEESLICMNKVENFINSGLLVEADHFTLYRSMTDDLVPTFELNIEFKVHQSTRSSPQFISSAPLTFPNIVPDWLSKNLETGEYFLRYIQSSEFKDDLKSLELKKTKIIKETMALEKKLKKLAKPFRILGSLTKN